MALISTPSKRLSRLLGVGYFAKELPPVFVTSSFAKYRSSLERSWPALALEQWKSVPEPLSLPKAGHARRQLAIVNPISEFKIAKLIADGWKDIRTHIKRSPLTEFAPVIDMLGERAVLQADAALAAKLRAALKKFELEMNAEKTSADSTGEHERPQWARRLQTFPYSHSRAEIGLRDYFDEVTELICSGDGEAVAKYGVKRSRAFPIPTHALPYYVDRLIHVSRLCPPALPATVQTILDRKASGAGLDLNYLKRFIIDSIDENAAVGHSFEVVWLLFLARGLQIPLQRREIRAVFQMESSPVALVAMDMDQRGLISRGVDQVLWQKVANVDGLRGPMWLLSYEAAKKGWWRGISDAYVRGDPLFGPMLAKGVSFYEEKRNVRTTTSELRRLLLSRFRYRTMFETIDDYF